MVSAVEGEFHCHHGIELVASTHQVALCSHNCTSVSQDVLTKLIRKEGFFSLWKGFTPYYARLGPHTVLTFIFLEQFRSLYYKYSRKDQ